VKITKLPHPAVFCTLKAFSLVLPKRDFNLDVALLLNFDLVFSAIVIDNILHFRPIKDFYLNVVRRRVFWHIFNP